MRKLGKTGAMGKLGISPVPVPHGMQTVPGHRSGFGSGSHPQREHLLRSSTVISKRASHQSDTARHTPEDDQRVNQ